MKFTVAGAVLFTCLLASAWAQTDATITGRVVDAVGEPVASVKLDISEQGKFQVHRLRGRYKTEEDGTFNIQHVPWGTYIVETSKQDEGYADTAMAFYSNPKPPTVTVSPILSSQDLTIVLGPKAGVLDASAVVDAVTGAHVDAVVTLRRVDSGSGIMTSSMVKNLLVPSVTPVTLEVNAQGYATWYYPGTTDASKGGTLSLQPGQKVELRIALQPAGSPSAVRDQ
jgi:hypothetical protein